MEIVDEIIEKELSKSDFYTAFRSDFWKAHQKIDIQVNKKVSIHFVKVSNQEIEIQLKSMYETYHVGNLLVKNLDKQCIFKSYVDIIKSNLMLVEVIEYENFKEHQESLKKAIRELSK